MSSTIDHGYAWVVAIACFFIQGTLFGIYRAYSLMYSVLLDQFKISRSDASWPISLCMTVVHLTGPVSGSLNQWFSVRSISFVGCLLSTIGVGIGYFADSTSGQSIITNMIVGIGIVQGFGIGLTYIQNSAIINQYFQRYRGTAIGISLSGGTVGAFVISHILSWSLDRFHGQGSGQASGQLTDNDFRWNFVVLAAISMLTLPIALLLKPFKSEKVIKSDSEADRDSIKKWPHNALNCQPMFLDFSRKSLLFNANLSNVSLTAFNENDKPKSVTEQDESSHEKVIGDKKSDDVNCEEQTPKTQQLQQQQSTPMVVILDPSEVLSSRTFNFITPCDDMKSCIDDNNRSIGNSDLNQRTPSSAITTIKSHFADVSIFKSKLKVPSDKSDLDDRMSSSTESPSTPTTTLNLISSIVKNRLFQLISLTHMAYFWSSITYTMIIVDYSLDQGLQMSASVDLINSFAIGDLVGRLSSGVIVDKNIVTLKLLTMSSMIGMGVLMVLSIFGSSYYSFITISTTLGLLSGVVNILLNQLFCHYIGADVAALCFGLSAFISGVATLARPVVVGYFRDSVDGSYKGLFISLAIFSIIVGLLWCFESRCVKHSEKSPATMTKPKTIRNSYLSTNSIRTITTSLDSINTIASSTSDYLSGCCHQNNNSNQHDDKHKSNNQV